MPFNVIQIGEVVVEIRNKESFTEIKLNTAGEHHKLFLLRNINVNPV
jgi:hypothetical protein